MNDPEEPISPEEALENLAEGNARYLSHNSENPPDYEQERADLVDGQHPYAIILSCSDSRVPPAIVFDETLGMLFVIRVAGNVIEPTDPIRPGEGSTVVGSIEYAVDHDYSRLLFVMAHESCGAVKTTMDAVRTNAYPGSPNLMAIVESIAPALDRDKLDTRNKVHVAVNVDRNLQAQMANVVKKSESLSNKVRSGHLLIVGAIYSLENGDANPIYYVDRTDGTVKPIPRK